MQAVDPEGTAITYGIVFDSTNASLHNRGNTTINQTTEPVHPLQLKVTGSFKARLSATDGVTTASFIVWSCTSHTLH